MANEALKRPEQDMWVGLGITSGGSKSSYAKGSSLSILARNFPSFLLLCLLERYSKAWTTYEPFTLPAVQWMFLRWRAIDHAVGVIEVKI